MTTLAAESTFFFFCTWLIRIQLQNLPRHSLQLSFPTNYLILILIIIFYIVMKVRQQKLTLSTPYRKINEALWQKKLLNSKKENQNKQLKTKIHQTLHRRPATSSVQQTNRQLQQQFAKLSQKYKEQAAWIKETNAQIDQRHFQQITVEVKKIENKLHKLTQTTLKREQKLKRDYLKKKQKENQCLSAEEDEDPLQKLEEQTKRLQKHLEHKQNLAQKLQISNKELNKEIIELLAIKNTLKNEARKASLLAQTESKTWFLKTKETITN